MVDLKPFAAYRLEEKWAKEVAALPYDVMSTQEALDIVRQHPYSFLNIDKPEIHIKEKGEAPYLYAAQKLKEMMRGGIYTQDQRSLYLYELESNAAHQYGLVGLVSVRDYKDGLIKRHENTRQDKEAGRVAHILHCRAHTGPIFLVEEGVTDFGEELINYTVRHRPLIQVTFEDGVTHRIYQMSELTDIKRFVELSRKIPALYIADGHHRAAAACRVAEELPQNKEAAHFLAVIFPKEQLHILPYHRVLKVDKGLTPQQLFSALEDRFEIEKVSDLMYLPSQKHVLGMRYRRQWYALHCKKDLYEGKNCIDQLDVSILQGQILLPLFHIIDPKNDQRLDFIPGPMAPQALNKQTEKEKAIAFSLYPPSMEELLSVANTGGLMPPKSTWFEPKLRSGFFIHCF